MDTFNELYNTIVNEYDDKDAPVINEADSKILGRRNMGIKVYKSERKRIENELKDAGKVLDTAKKAMKEAIWQHDKAKLAAVKAHKFNDKEYDKVMKTFNKEEAQSEKEKNANK